ncbi:hypothetical protein EJ02DRAFT_469845 [Clathrospora elynae]|uniref:Uncharacterized protein n=1 Tax=Clathrospora elynae TaxID=706981 RepID=A0A6A5SCD4_9PLEO|nr:hypothetical protein EJ02DRAFT_469845 [Clathrospora elynae]
MRTTDSTHSGFLSLPTELRCHMYDYLLADEHAITISAGYITSFGNRIQDRARKTDIPGLPVHLAPLARCHHDASLLSVAEPPTIAIDDGCMDDINGEKLGYPAPFALLLTSRLINDELTDYMRGKRRIARARSTDTVGTTHPVEDDKEGLSLYVSYPYGVLVLKTLYPFLLKQARRVYISGYYAPKDEEPISPLSPEASDDESLTPTSSFATSFSAPAPLQTFRRRTPSNNAWTRAASHSVSANPTRPRLRIDPPPPRQQRDASRTTTLFPSFSNTTAALAPAALTLLVRTLLPPEPTQLVKLSARILYPGEKSYGSVWSNDESPVSHILRNICGGNIDMQVKRGSLATGLLLTARPKPEARVVSTSWENWKAGTTVRNGPVRRPMGQMSVGDLDSFLTGEQ